MTKKNKFLRIVLFLLMIFILFVLLWNLFDFIRSEKATKLTFPFPFPFPSPSLKIDINIVDPSYDAKVFLFQFFSFLVTLTIDIGSIFINTFQDVIIILFSGLIFYNAIGIDYITYFWIILGIFFFFLLVFLGVKFLKIGTRKGTNNDVGKHIFNSFILLIIILLLFQILFLGSRYFFEKVLGVEISSINIFSSIKESTIDNLPSNIMIPINQRMYESVLLKIKLGRFRTITILKIKFNITIKKVFWVNWNSLIIPYVFIFLFTTWFILTMLIKFSLKMFQRLIDIFVFGFIGLPFVAASALNDDGKYLSEWNRIMIRKTFNPFLSLSMYLLLLISMNSIFDLIDNIKTTESSISLEALILTLKFVVLNGTFVVLNKFSNNYSNNIIKINTENNVEEFIAVNLSNQKNINYDFDRNYLFSNINNIGINDKKEVESGISIDKTLEKINER